MKVVTPVTGLFEGYVLLNQDIEPSLTWKGGLISPPLWGKIVTFFREVYRVQQTEATMRLFYHEGLGSWSALVFDQQVSGASAKETGDITTSPEYLAMVAAGYQQFGTIHSHASMTAFQSGTDKHDEASSPGLHITVGTLDKLPTFQSRLVFRGSQYETRVNGWVEIPMAPWMAGIPEQYLPAIVEKYAEETLATMSVPVEQVAEWVANVKTWKTGLQIVGAYNGWNPAHPYVSPYSKPVGSVWRDVDAYGGYGATGDYTEPSMVTVRGIQIPFDAKFATDRLFDVVEANSDALKQGFTRFMEGVKRRPEEFLHMEALSAKVSWFLSVLHKEDPELAEELIMLFEELYTTLQEVECPKTWDDIMDMCIVIVNKANVQVNA